MNSFWHFSEKSLKQKPFSIPLCKINGNEIYIFSTAKEIKVKCFKPTVRPKTKHTKKIRSLKVK